jgi:signal transduction histidine kinase/ligand-binding sensor domain-containing protein
VLFADAQSLLRYHNFTIKKLSQTEGLSQGSNYFLHEDKLGYMWITANDAINRYDGSWVKVYKEERYFKNCPVLKQGYCFAEDGKSNMYVGSTIGLYKYTRSNDDFTLLKVFKGYADEDCIPFAFRDNKIWCYNRFYSIAAIDVTTGKISFYKDINTEAIESIHAYMFGKTSYRNRQPFFDRNGILWITTSSDIISYNPAIKAIGYYLHNDMKKRNLSFLSDCYDSSKNRIIAGTNNGLCLFYIESKKVEFTNRIQKILLGSVDGIREINNDFICHSSGITVSIVSEDFKNIFPLGNSNNFQFETSTSDPVCVDKYNRVWLCKSGFGLNILDFNHATFSKEVGYKNDPGYFFKRGTHSFAEYPNGNVLIRSGDELFTQNHLSNIVTNLNQYSGGAASITLRNDYQRNGIWLFYNNKIILLNCKTNKPSISVDCNESKYGIVNDIEVLAADDVWLALSSGIYNINFRKHKLDEVKNLESPNPFQINIINKNRVAISYLNGDMLLAQIKNADSAKIISKILPGIKCLYLQQDSIKNMYWVGADDGVYMLDENFNLKRKFDATNDLSGSYIYGLLLDKENNVWVSHEKGLSRINTKNLQAINYDEDDNIQDRDYNNRCFFKAKDGTLYFGGIKGFNYFIPPVVIPSFYKPELYIDEIKVNNVPVFADTNYTYVNELKLTPQQNKINIHATVKDLDIVHSNEIIYRFKNLDTVWQHLPANSNIIFNNLAAGNYQLELGYYNTKQKKYVLQKHILISISRPFYQTILFWILISAAISALFVWNFNHTKLKKQKRLIEQQAALIKERNRITSDLHDDVGSSLSSLQIHSVIAKQLIDSDADKAKKYLDKIVEQSAGISSNVSDIIWSMKSQEDRLVDMDGRIRNLVSNLLGATNINYLIEIEKPLEHAVQNITARKNIMLIIKEALNNCAKYSHATECTLSVQYDDEALTITINDNGKGIPSANMKTGNGLQNMRKRTEELKGTIHLETAENAGVHLKFIIPATEIRG